MLFTPFVCDSVVDVDEVQCGYAAEFMVLCLAISHCEDVIPLHFIIPYHGIVIHANLTATAASANRITMMDMCCSFVADSYGLKHHMQSLLPDFECLPQCGHCLNS